MHGLIFKIKESHRQDQSESFVIYLYIYIEYTYIYNVYICISFYNKSNEITSLWPVFFICIYDIVIILSLFHRDETKPTHIIGINSFLFFNTTHLQAFKPKLLTYDQLLKIDQQYMCVYVCISWNIFNRIHFFAICDDIILYIYMQFVRFYMIFIYDYIWKVDEAASSNVFFFFFIIYNFISHC